MLNEATLARLIAVYRDPSADPAERIAAATECLPFFHVPLSPPEADDED